MTKKTKKQENVKQHLHFQEKVRKGSFTNVRFAFRRQTGVNVKLALLGFIDYKNA